MTSAEIVAGIDVGGPRKGFHGVALIGGNYLGKFASQDAATMADWCRNTVSATAVGIDAPCRWSATGRMRPAERELARELVSCFATPSREAAQTNPFYNWMRNGAALFAEIEKYYPLLGAQAPAHGERVCFETFPQAIACALAGERVSARQKGTIRRELLAQAGVATAALTNIDTVDAALCALAAHYFLLNRYRRFGDAATGFIVAPALAELLRA
jgi:predicted nuclease with RNAse H fold